MPEPPLSSISSTTAVVDDRSSHTLHSEYHTLSNYHWHAFLAGTVAGVAGTLVGHPLDLVKVRLQSNRALYRGSALTCLTRIVAEEGVRSLWKGVIPPLISLSFGNTLSFGIYTGTKKTFREYLGKEAARLEYFLAGGMTGLALTAFSTPFEFIKVQMQLDNISTKKYLTSAACVRSLIETYGPKILFTGCFVNACRETSFCCIYFFTYDSLRDLRFQLTATHSPNTYYHYLTSVVCSSAVAGGISGVLSWTASFPVDVIKTHIQGRPNLLEPLSVKTVARQLWAQHGAQAFYSGLGISLARSFVVASTRFSAFEAISNYFEK